MFSRNWLGVAFALLLPSVALASGGNGGVSLTGVQGTSGQVTVSTTSGVATVSLPGTITPNLIFSGTVTLPAAQVVNGVTLSSSGSSSLYLNEAGTYSTPAGSGGLTVGTTTITSGTNTKVEMDNSGVLGEYAISGTGSVAMTTSPAFTTPNLGTPSAATLTNATGLPISSGISGLGTGVATLLSGASSGTGGPAGTASPTFTGTLNGAASIWSALEKIDLNSSSLPSAQTGTVLQVGNANSTSTRIEADAFASSGYHSTVRWDGTAASPTALSSGDEIGGFNAFGSNGTAVVGPQASFRTYAAQNWSVGSNGTYADIAVTPDSSSTLTEVAYFGPTTVSGALGIGIGTSSPADTLDMSQHTDAITLPGGTSAQRPSGAAGQLRYNSATPGLEAYYNSQWNALGSGGSGGSVSLTASTPDLAWSPSPTTGTGSIGMTYSNAAASEGTLPIANGGSVYNAIVTNSPYNASGFIVQTTVNPASNSGTVTQSGTTLTVVTNTGGTLGVGSFVTIPGDSSETITALGTGTGGTGTYTVTGSQTISTATSYTATGVVPSGVTTIPVVSGSAFNTGQIAYIAQGGSSGAVSGYKWFACNVSSTASTSITCSGTSVSGNAFQVYAPASSGTSLTTAVPSGYTVFSVGTTTLSASAADGATSISLTNAASYQVGQGILIYGGGASAANLVTTISGVSGNTLTIANAIANSSGVSSGTYVQHDDSNAFQTALNLTSPSKTLNIFVPDGFYQINTPLPGTNTNELNIPLVNSYFTNCCYGTDSYWGAQAVVNITGSIPAPQNQGYLAEIEIAPMSGAIIQSSQRGQYASTNAILGSASGSFGYEGFNNVQLFIKNLTFREYPNPQIVAVNGSNIGQLSIYNSSFDTGDIGLTTQPTYSSPYYSVEAITGPAAGNGGNDVYSQLEVYGYYDGITIAEHTRLEHVRFDNVYQPVTIANTVYGITGVDVQFNGCPHGIYTYSTSAAVDFSLLNIEHQSTPSWVTNSDDINDSNDVLTGFVSLDMNVANPTVVGGTKLHIVNSHSASYPLATYAYSSLPSTPPSGTQVFCSNCTATPTCASGGNGAYAQYINSAWTCNADNPTINLGTSASATNPQRSGQAGTGIFSATSDVVSVGAGGNDVGDFTSTGLNNSAIGASTPSTAAFTTLSASGGVTMTGLSSGTVASNSYIGLNSSNQLVLGSGGSGGGGVTSFSGDGTLISNSSSTGAVTATLANATAYSLWGNNTGSSAAPGYKTAPVISGALETLQDIGATSTDGLDLYNTTAAASGAQQWSPRLHWEGQGWKTTATAASEAVDFIAEVQPVQGTSAPTGNLVFSNGIDGGSYTSLMSLNSDGALTLNNSVASSTLYLNGNASYANGYSGIYFQIRGNNEAQIYTSDSQSNLIIYDGSSIQMGPEYAGNSVYFGYGNPPANYALAVTPTSSEVDYVQITGGVAGTPGSATVSVVGSDTNANLVLTAKGNGAVKLTSHQLFSGTAPAVSSCGTSPSIDSAATDSSGTVTVGSGTVASCTVTFNAAYQNSVHCRVTPETASISAFGYSYTKTAITVTGTSLTSDVFDYSCDGQ